ncbi:hypothetical protein F8M41_022507 [Gigaspora margarita]|uniref:Uncharacterized protein n=1 Tax=Gigaspora margarita TaxID=4874 RepID=A0A8H4B541_GIGMA|nr:hypothetical protein F8M41_022507 [Gigaspora margarita]
MKKLLLTFILTFLIITVTEASNLNRNDHYLISLFQRQEESCLSPDIPCGEDCCTSTQVCSGHELCCDKSRACGDECCFGTEVCVGNSGCCDPGSVCGGGLHEANCCDASQKCVHGKCT